MEPVNQLIKPDPQIALLEKTRNLLASAQSLETVLKVRSTAKAIEQYARSSKRDNGDLGQYAESAVQADKVAWEAKELCLRAERTAGGMLDQSKKSGDRAAPTDNLRHVSKSHAVTSITLPELGISRMQSSRWQQMAAVPPPVFEAYIEKVRAKAFAELSRAGLLRIVKEAEREDKRERNRRIVDQTEPAAALPQAAYSAIVIDPPWDWGDEGDADQLGRARPVYGTMSVEEIAEELLVGELAFEDAHLYLWITNRSLPKGFWLFEQWGFRYITLLTWVKPSFGMGNYFRGSTEHVMFGVRGSLPLLVQDQATHFTAPRPGPHSAKPPEFYRIVERCSPGPWLEMFARGNRPGWSVWGAEA
jgi:N6-adenosine-specific RNA methylase IME4